MFKKLNTEEKVIMIAALLGLVVVIWFIMFISKPSEKKTDICRECYYYSQLLVKDELKSPKSAKFPIYDESFADYDESKGIVVISAYVDADNSFGANIRTKYVATITVSNGEPKSGFVVI